MIKFSEFVSLGHPDKIADYISQYLLDRYIEHDPQTRYAVEVQIKGYQVTLGGEVSSKHHFSAQEIRDFVRASVNEIGYTREYQQKWGADNTICGDLLDVAIYICQQSNDIAQGLSGWGDQGIFFGYCEYRPDTCGMPLDHTLAKRLCKDLFESGIGGLDIKTQVITRNDKVEKVIVAIPLLDDTSKKTVKHFVRSRIKGRYQLIINGTGRYVKHSSIADCGTTGRKLAVDFYGGNSKLGGGSPWTKDASKADLTLNLAARPPRYQLLDEIQNGRNDRPRLLHRQTGGGFHRSRHGGKHVGRGDNGHQSTGDMQGVQVEHPDLCVYVPLGAVRRISTRQSMGIGL